MQLTIATASDLQALIQYNNHIRFTARKSGVSNVRLWTLHRRREAMRPLLFHHQTLPLEDWQRAALITSGGQIQHSPSDRGQDRTGRQQRWTGQHS